MEKNMSSKNKYIKDHLLKEALRKNIEKSFIFSQT